MNVAKFGGSSVANATQIRKIADIIKSDENRKFIVVSAPGKRDKEDTKVTDLLINLEEAYRNEQDYEQPLSAIQERFREIVKELELDDSNLDEIFNKIESVLHDELSDEMKLDAIKAIGEDSSAKLVSAFLNKQGILASYINPKEAGIIVSDEPGNAQILPES